MLSVGHLGACLCLRDVGSDLLHDVDGDGVVGSVDSNLVKRKNNYKKMSDESTPLVSSDSFH